MTVITDNYNKIARAIRYISCNAREQPSLDEVAAHVNLSPFHFQKLFTEWAGVSPKKFLQFLTVDYAKKILASKQNISLFDTAEETGLSGSGRLHDLFVTIERMTPGEFKNRGANLEINYTLRSSRFGNYLIASTQKGICNLYFFDDELLVLSELRNNWENAQIVEQTDEHQEKVEAFFNNRLDGRNKLNLHLKGTGFQLKVWEALLKIPQSSLTTYGSIAQSIHQPQASRAVGTAIGSNEVAYIIPCHRVIRNVGGIGEFRWGSARKKAMIGWEAGMLYTFIDKTIEGQINGSRTTANT